MTVTPLERFIRWTIDTHADRPAYDTIHYDVSSLIEQSGHEGLTADDVVEAMAGQDEVDYAFANQWYNSRDKVAEFARWIYCDQATTEDLLRLFEHPETFTFEYVFLKAWKTRLRDFERGCYHD